MCLSEEQKRALSELFDRWGAPDRRRACKAFTNLITEIEFKQVADESDAKHEGN